jgi:predicted ATPase
VIQQRPAYRAAEVGVVSTPVVPAPPPLLPSIRLDRDWVKSFDVYPFSLPAVRTLGTLPLHPAVTYFVGENGSGKSTLLEAIAVAMGLNAEGGSRNIRFTTRASHSVLHAYLDLGLDGQRPPDGFFLRAESFFNLATEVDRLERENTFGRSVLDAYGGRSLHDQSHGEAFFSIFERRLNRRGVFLLDEPEAALSPTRQLALMRLVHRMVRGGAQLIIATHSPILLAYPEAWIYEFGPLGISRTTYDESDNVRVMREFLARRDQIVASLLDR